MMDSIHNASDSLLTDFYQLTMAYGFWKSGLSDKESVFHLFFRRAPFGGNHVVSCGLENIISHIGALRFEPEDLEYLGSVTGNDGKPIFEEGFLTYLSELEFRCSIDSVPEGTIVFPLEPMIRIQGPIVQCQLLETPLLNLMNFPSLIATKAARIRQAARGDSVLEFGLRRAQGVDGAVTASRSAYIGGCDATSNVLAGKRFGIPVKGTIAHSWVMAFADETEAFRAYSKVMPNNCVLLVDTYSTIDGVEKAIQVGKELDEKGYRLSGIRLDSGDLADLSGKARDLLDNSGFPDVRIVASSDLDETIIRSLKARQASIDIWGVGTKLITAFDQPALDGVYKLSAIRTPGRDWEYKIKVSDQSAKATIPGIQQVRRYYRDDLYDGDVIYDLKTDLSAGCTLIDPSDTTGEKTIGPDVRYQDLLVPIYRQGKLVYELPTIEEIRQKVQTEIGSFHPSVMRLTNPDTYLVGNEKSLNELKAKLTLRAGVKKREKMRALILVDIQNDFSPTGAFPVPEGDQVVSVANNILDRFELVVATQDWHPPDHKSFAVHHDRNPGEIIMLNGIEQILWPVHCVQGSTGSEFIAGLNRKKMAKVFQKGLEREVDSYSGFFDNNHRHDTGLGDYLKEQGVNEVYIAGLALDFCVKFTALDAAALGFKTKVVVDASRAVNVNKGDGERAIAEMQAVGVEIVMSEDV